jgi:hypothetical protein
LEKALETIVEHRNRRAKWLPDNLELSFATELWQKNIRIRKSGKHIYRVSHRMLEICVFSYLAFELKTGDMYVEGAQDYADYRSHLLSWAECEPLVAAYCTQMDLPADAVGLVKDLKETLSTAARHLDENLPQNEHLTINAQGLPSLKGLKLKSYHRIWPNCKPLCTANYRS